MADPIRRLVQELARLPGIGEKSATRLAFHLIRGNRQQVQDLAQALLDVTDKIRLCSVCMTMTESDPCSMCTDPRREPEDGNPLGAGDLADLCGGGAGDVQDVAVALHAVAAALQGSGQPRRILRADLCGRTVVAAEDLLQRALGAQLTVGDDDDVVDRLGHLRQDVA